MTIRPAAPLLSLGLLLPLVASGAPLPFQEPPVFKVGVELVRLDVIVLDHDGHPVTGLSAGDFTVEEGGRPQRIESFEPIVLRGTSPETPAGPPPLTVSRIRAPQEGRCLFFLFDDIHITPPTAEPVRAALRQFVANDLRGGDWVTLMTADKSVWWTARNPWEYEQLPPVIARLTSQGRGNTYGDWLAVRGAELGQPGVTGGQQLVGGGAAKTTGPPDRPQGVATAGVASGGGGLASAEVEALIQRNTGITLGALRAALESLAPLRGHKSLVLISDGFLILPGMPACDEAIDLARRAHVAIYFLDARGLDSGVSAEARSASTVLPGTALSLPVGDVEGMAEVTGGRTLVSNDPEIGLRRVAEESEAYYLVGYAPDRPGPGERKVRVGVRRAGLTVRARTRYFVPGAKAPGAPAPTGEGAEERAPTPEVLAMRALADTTDLPLRVATLFFEPNKKEEVATMLAAEVVPPSGTTGKRLFKLTSEARFRDGATTVFDHFEGSPEVTAGVPVVLARQWHLPPGVWQVRLLVADTTTGHIGTTLHTFEVPDPKSFRISTPILTTELEDPNGKRQPKVGLRRTFRSGSVLYCQYNVYEAAAGGKHDWAPHVFGSWTLRRGDEVLREAPPTLIQPAGDGRLTRTLGLSLQGTPVGEYSLTLAVRDERTGATLSRTEPFTVAP